MFLSQEYHRCWLRLLGEFINSRDNGGCKPQQPSPLTELPGLDAIHMFSKSSILFIPVIKQDMSQQYTSMSYRETGKCPEGKQSKIKQEVLVAVASPLLRAGGFFAQVVASIASIELLHDQWPDLIKLLLGFMNNLTDTNLRITMLQMIGYICKSIGEHNHIIQVMCEATQNPSVSAQVGAFECLIKIMALTMTRWHFTWSKPFSWLWIMVNHLSAGTYFNFMAWAVTDPIVDTVIPFIEAYIKSPNQHQWGAAMISILTDMVAWTLGRIHGLLIATIKPAVHLHPLVLAWHHQHTTEGYRHMSGTTY
ncbi:hypothetical protein EDC04DRAFT_2602732 [Pisolithus marmoratus]|nr:hypothetical protein EDC04DRAFT_2602732 [Pisolithus marmoratus]